MNSGIPVSGMHYARWFHHASDASYVAPAWCRWFAGLGAYYASPNCWSIDSFSVRRSLVSVQKPETRRDPWTLCTPFPNEIHDLQPTKLSWLCTSKFKWILLTIRDFYCHACLPHCMNPNEFKISYMFGVLHLYTSFYADLMTFR